MLHVCLMIEFESINGKERKSDFRLESFAQCMMIWFTRLDIPLEQGENRREDSFFD